MSKSEKIIKLLSDFVENGILSSQDVKKEILTNFKFKKDDLIDKLDLVSREEFEVLKKVIARQEIEIKKLSKKKTKKAR
jgi:BMFP domain-containing protein YqiC|tara:strand:- start:435 stop:671 length:237 start_codon:yes stop_codon:yes gene_type:complete